MQIKPIFAAASLIACMLPEWTGTAAGAPNPPSEMLIIAMTEDKADAKAGEQHMTETRKAATTVSVRNTRPKVDRHKDARACLDAKKNEAVIKCANKYR